jgi:hypothetical protein
MHCPRCGTENVSDSRFCGTCGAKLGVEGLSRVAPTAKISDDATFPPSGTGRPTPPNYYPQPASIPPNSYIAPQYQTGPPSLPPQNSGLPPRAASIPPQPNDLASAAPQVTTPSNMYQPPGYAREPSMAPPASARWGLIVCVLVLDLGLAGAGALLLQKGLAKQPDAPAEKVEPKAAASSSPAASASSSARATPTMAPAPQPGLAASVNAIAQTAPPPPASVAVAPAIKKSAPVARAKGASPEDPYDAQASLPGEIELASARSKDDLAKCQAQERGRVHGRIDIAFTIEHDGGVTRVTSKQDTTGSPTLAPCLSSVIRRWAFASHPANATDFVRPFIYN